MATVQLLSPVLRHGQVNVPRIHHRPARLRSARVNRAKVYAVASDSIVQDLQERFGIPGHVEFQAGQGGLPQVVLKHACGAKAAVYLYGACISSWQQPNGSEVLYIRPDAVFDKSKPISGGVPLCFPQFGPGVMQQHGFARNLEWEVGSTSADPQPDDRDPEVELILTDNDYTRAMWPHSFNVSYSVCLHGDLLRTEFRVLNTGDDAFTFTAALHTYFEVLKVGAAKVRGLKGLTYLDKASDPNNPTSRADERDAITFEPAGALVDTVYLGTPEYVELSVGTGAAIGVTNRGWSDTVVWNPGTTMPACYERFVCVENAKCGEAVELQPGDVWTAFTQFEVVDE